MQNEKISKLETFDFPDSLFPYKNIKDSKIVDRFYYNDKTNQLYADSNSTPFFHLDSIQKLKLIVPLLVPKITESSDYVIHNMDAIFVSKQKIRGNLTPIIVWVSGDDYGGLFYILLDSSFKLISHYLLHGGVDAGPTMVEDSVMELPPVFHSVINTNEISSYSLTEVRSLRSIKKPSIFDSVTYTSKILPSGKIETKKIDSTRFERTSKW